MGDGVIVHDSKDFFISTNTILHLSNHLCFNRVFPSNIYIFTFNCIFNIFFFRNIYTRIDINEERKRKEEREREKIQTTCQKFILFE